MIKLSLECYQTTRHHHVISQPIPFITHPVSKLILPHIQSHPPFKQFQTVPRIAPSTKSKNLSGSNLSNPLKILYTSIKSTLRNLVSSVVKFKIHNLSKYPRPSSPSIIFVALLWTFSSLSTSFLRCGFKCLYAVIQVRSNHGLIQWKHYILWPVFWTLS